MTEGRHNVTTTPDPSEREISAEIVRLLLEAAMDYRLDLSDEGGASHLDWTAEVFGASKEEIAAGHLMAAQTLDLRALEDLLEHTSRLISDDGDMIHALHACHIAGLLIDKHCLSPQSVYGMVRNMQLEILLKRLLPSGKCLEAIRGLPTL